MRLAVALSYGAACQSCSPGKCRDLPTRFEPLRLRCISCNGAGCGSCNDLGYLLITDCPQKLIAPDVWEALRCCRFADKGLGLPCAGGILDQSRPFMDALELYQSDSQNWKSRLKIFDFC